MSLDRIIIVGIVALGVGLVIRAFIRPATLFWASTWLTLIYALAYVFPYCCEPDLANEPIRYVLLWLFAFWGGYILWRSIGRTRTRETRNPGLLGNTRASSLIRYSPIARCHPDVGSTGSQWTETVINKIAVLLLALQILALILLAHYYIGWENLLTNYRGANSANQWVYRQSKWQVFVLMFSTGLGLLTPIVAGGLNGLLLRLRKRHNPTVYLCLLPALFSGVSKFSRGMLLPLLMFYLATLSLKQRVTRVDTARLICIGLIAAVGFPLGFAMRADDSLRGAWTVNILDSVRSIDATMIVNSIDGSKTLQWCFEYADEPDYVAGIVAIGRNLNPMPSMFGISLANASLSEFRGVAGHTGIPMPVLGELFFRLGYGSLILAFFFGVLMECFEFRYMGDHDLSRDQVLFSRLLNLALLYGAVLSVHSASRASTRASVWVLAIWAIYRLYRNWGMRSQLHPSRQL